MECRRDRARSPERALQKRARPNAHLLLIRARLAVFSQKLEDLVHSLLLRLPQGGRPRRCRHFFIHEVGAGPKTSCALPLPRNSELPRESRDAARARAAGEGGR